MYENERKQYFKNIQDIISREFHIIGAGGIGSHVFTKLWELGARKISIYDNDKLEMHNLSRTLFEHGTIGDFKTNQYSLAHASCLSSKIKNSKFKNEAIRQFKGCSDLKEMRELKCEITNVETHFNNPTFVTDLFTDFSLLSVDKENGIIVDCTDKYFSEDCIGGKEKSKYKWWKLNYDNTNIAVTSNPYAVDENGNFKMNLAMLAQGGGYNVTPSFLLTPELVTNMWMSLIIRNGIDPVGTRQYYGEIGKLTRNSIRKVG